MAPALRSLHCVHKCSVCAVMGWSGCIRSVPAGWLASCGCHIALACSTCTGIGVCLYTHMCGHGCVAMLYANLCRGCTCIDTTAQQSISRACSCYWDDHILSRLAMSMMNGQLVEMVPTSCLQPVPKIEVISFVMASSWHFLCQGMPCSCIGAVASGEGACTVIECRV